jgi:SAM-dependent methyltransferase
MITISTKGFKHDDGSIQTYLDLSQSAVSNEWVQKQEASIEEYKSHQSEAPKEVELLYQLFDGYIASEISGQKNQTILDVGCGISREYPLYASSIENSQSTIGNIYVGLDPLLIDVKERKYLFIAGRLEDLSRVMLSQFDVFIFSTSLDHFEDIDDVCKSIFPVAKKGARLIFWVGLHDPGIVSQSIGTKLFRNLYGSINPIRFSMLLLKTNILLLFNYLQMLKRRIFLSKNLKLDNLHFHYFTEGSIVSVLSRFGAVKRVISIPGTNSIFATVTIQEDQNP